MSSRYLVPHLAAALALSLTGPAPAQPTADGKTWVLLVAGQQHDDHQDDKAYLVPKDLKVADIPGTGYPVRELHEALAGCKAGTKFLILDCCQSGGADRAVGDLEARPEMLARRLGAEQLAGTVVL